MALKGKGTKIRWAVLPDGSKDRPANLALIRGVQTSEIKGGQEISSNEETGDYESVDGATPTWQDGDTVKSLNWSFTINARVKEDAQQAQGFRDLWAAWKAGKKIWIERLRPGDTHWKGGRAILLDPTEPVPWDGEMTFSSGVRGQGELVELPVAQNP